MACTAPGLRRSRNEDAILVESWYSSSRRAEKKLTLDSRKTPLLLAVADGMGGHAAGDIASRLLVEGLRDLAGMASGEQQLDEILTGINRQMRARMRASPELSRMGSTVAGVVVDGSRVIHFNVGDSRIYHLGGERLRQLSVDDSVDKHFLTQVIGGSRDSDGGTLDIHYGETRIVGRRAVAAMQ